MSVGKNVIFTFNNLTNTIKLSIKYILEQKASLQLIIKNECNSKVNLFIFEDNIILYDEKNDVLINTVQDLIENKTKICKIIIRPINY